jgi:secreted PhoX family phosphatase
MSSRREFIKISGLATLGFMGLNSWLTSAEAAVYGTSYAYNPRSLAGYGPLVKDPEGILNLPAGFRYSIISRAGDKMDDGLSLPGLPDGMAAFSGRNGRVIVVRNHEVAPDRTEHGAFGKSNELLSQVDPEKFYDYGKSKAPGLGGTSTFIYDPNTGKIERQFLSLAGTARNCAGGPTPWNSWLTCEETVFRVGAYDGNAEKDHGYVFEVPATETVGLADPLPIKAMGRFNHEAVAVDSRTGIVYLTEDRGDSLIYRYIPNTKGKLHRGGKLQALAIVGQKSFDTRNWETLSAPKFPLRQPVDVEWIDIENVESPEDDLRYQGFNKGAACFARGEGMWYGNNEIYFACTNGGPKQNGQVFRYIPSRHEGKRRERRAPGKLELFAESPNKEILKNCDNLTVAPWGDVVLCEDAPDSCLVGITPDGEYYKLAENIGFKSEFAGGVFSPSGETYFVNLQGAGLTIAITGPWKKRG